MDQESELENFLADIRLSEEKLNLAYANCAKDLHAAIKTAIAVTHKRLGTLSPWQQSKTAYPHLGCICQEESKPLSSLLLVIDPANCAPARMVQLAVLPRLAFVDHVYAFFLEEPDQLAILSLELSGVDAILTGQASLLSELIAVLPKPFQITVLGTPPPALANQKLLFVDQTLPRIFIEEDLFDLNLISALQAPFAPILNPLEADIIFADKTKAESLFAAQTELIVTQGLEGFWQYRNLAPTAYLVRKTYLEWTAETKSLAET